MTENFPGPMAGRTALVTGGTGGIGRATAATGIVRESGNPAVDALPPTCPARPGYALSPSRSPAPTRGWMCWSQRGRVLGHQAPDR